LKEYYSQLVVKPDSCIDTFSSLLLNLTGSAIEQKDGSIIVRSEEGLSDISWAVDEFAKKIGVDVEQTLTKKENRDWIELYKSSIKPIEIASFYIRPDWETKKNNLIDIVINPAFAFGSGHHESTSSCIEIIDRYVTRGNTLLDVGCGSGILAICANKKGVDVSICDTDEVALSSAKENFALNSATLKDSWVGSVDKADIEYDYVVANIVADVIMMIDSDLKRVVKQSGYLILSGIIDRYFQKVIDRFSDFLVVENIDKKGWHTLILKRK
jgi:ribosomal protein L11 methyltransferase